MSYTISMVGPNQSLTQESIVVDFRLGYDARSTANFDFLTPALSGYCFIAFKNICKMHPEDLPEPTLPLIKM
jgi:hypothetical protein